MTPVSGFGSVVRGGRASARRGCGRRRCIRRRGRARACDRRSAMFEGLCERDWRRLEIVQRANAGGAGLVAVDRAVGAGGLPGWDVWQSADERQWNELLRHMPERLARTMRRRVGCDRGNLGVCSRLRVDRASCWRRRTPWKSPKFASSSWKTPANGCRPSARSRSTTASSSAI